MPVSIIESFQLGTNLPLDARYVVDSIYDVSLYWFPGMQVFQTSDSQLYWYDGTVWSPVVDTSSGEWKDYVDGSLSQRDVSIAYLKNWNISQDSSILRIDGSLNVIFAKDLSQDASIVRIDGSINAIFSKDLSQDASIVALRAKDASQDASINSIWVKLGYVDTSLNNLGIKNVAQDASIIRIDTSLGQLNAWSAQLDASIKRIDTSLGDYVRKSGDIMSGNLVIQTDLSVNGKGSFGQLNVSGTSFPGSPINGDLFYRNDLFLQFVYDSSRGKWLSTNRASYTVGRSSAHKNSTVYMGVADAVMSSAQGLRMPRNGVITSVSLDNATTVTAANRTLDIRVNNSTTNRVQLLITTGNKGAYLTGANQNFSAGDLLQAVLISNGSDTFTDVLVIFEVAWRE
ncbi:MAG TPA: hypothetical protein PK122_01380 [Candidatus Paceibacterota bacterium]|nr:hypothetical protein [Candidatus Paceibacterota bacterium]